MMAFTPYGATAVVPLAIALPRASGPSPRSQRVALVALVVAVAPRALGGRSGPAPPAGSGSW